MTTQIQKLKENAITQQPAIHDMIKKSVVELGKALPAHMSAERLVRIALTTLRLNPDLYKCTPESMLGALFQSAQLGLEPNVEGQAYIIPFNNSRKRADGSGWHTVKEAQFQIGYKGYVELFYRHEAASTLFMDKVCENDEFEYAYGTDPFLKHRPADGDRGAVIGYYAIATLKNGGKPFKYMTKHDCMEHGQSHSKCYSKKDGEFYKNTPWATNPDAMCMKTVLIQLMKLLPKSIEVQKALAMDETVKTKVDKDMFNVPSEITWTVDDGAIEQAVSETDGTQDTAADSTLPKT